MKKIGTGLFFVFLCTLIFAKDYSKEFMDYFKSDYRSIDYQSMEKLLIDWEKECPDDPEMLIGYFNYYVNRNLDMFPATGRAYDGKYYGAYLQKNFNNEDVIKGISFLDKAPVKIRKGRIYISENVLRYYRQGFTKKELRQYRIC